MSGISSVVAGLRRSGIREVMDLVSRRPDVLHLELGEPDFPTPPHVIEAVAERMAPGQVKYTLSRGTPALRELLAAKLAERNAIPAGPDHIVVTPGGTAAVHQALTVVTEPGDGVLIPDPGWPSYDMIVRLIGARPVRYALRPESGFAPDLDELERLAPGARVLVVNTPSNPTGAVLGGELQEGLLELARRHDLQVVSDEVYEDIVFDAAHHSLAAGGDDRVVSVFSFSKGYAMTGWRLGYLVARPEVVEAVVRVQEAFLACPSWIAQVAAEAALTGPQDCVAQMREAYRERRDAAVAALRREGLFVAAPQGAFYAMAHLGPAAADTFAAARRLIVDEDVAVAPGETFGPAGAQMVRLSLASPAATVAEGIARIGRAARNWEQHGG